MRQGATQTQWRLYLVMREITQKRATQSHGDHPFILGDTFKAKYDEKFNNFGVAGTQLGLRGPPVLSYQLSARAAPWCSESTDVI